MYCVLVQPCAYDDGMETDLNVMGPYQSMEKAQEIADKIEAKYPRTDGTYEDARAWVCETVKGLRHMYGIIKEEDHNYKYAHLSEDDDDGEQ